MGIVINGVQNESSESFIELYSKVPIIARIPFYESINKQSVANCAKELKKNLLFTF